MKLIIEMPEIDRRIIMVQSPDKLQWSAESGYKLVILKEELNFEDDNTNSEEFDVSDYEGFDYFISEKDDKLFHIENDLILEAFLKKYKEYEIKKLDAEISDVELEDEDEIEVPKPDFDPELIRLDPRVYSSLDIKRFIDSKRIDLSPDFQRNFVWKEIRKRSRLIESLLLRIPLPAFYLAEDNEGTLQVVDGLQRLTVIHEFLGNNLKLKELEYLEEECGNKTYKELPIKYQRRVDDTQLTFNVITPTTPFKVKFEIFKRLNQGGVPLSHQEIRNSMVKKNIRKFIRELSISQNFREATDYSIRPLRMEDQDFVLRFIGFYFVKIEKIMSYKPGMENFLNDVVEYMNANEKKINFTKIEEAFYNSMKLARHLFDRYAFRKYTNWSKRRPPVNKAMFVTWSITLSQYDFETVKKHIRKKAFVSVLKNKFNEDRQYLALMTHGTSNIANLDYGFSVAQNLLNEHLQ